MSASARCLVIGSSGFLGSHVAKALVEQGHQVRTLARKGSDTRGTQSVENELERHWGSAFDEPTLRTALADMERVYYCIVDARSWLRDSTPLWQTNVHNLERVLATVGDFPIQQFVFTSSLITIGTNGDQPADERHANNWMETAPDYVKTRVAAEDLVLTAAKQGKVPAVACCVANTYGPEDWQPTPHGKVLCDASRGQMPVIPPGGGESVDVRDAALGMILAGEQGQVGERYIFSERYTTMKELIEMAAQAGGVSAPRITASKTLLYALATLNDAWHWLRGADNSGITRSSINLLTSMPVLSHHKASSELGWRPRPIEHAVQDAVAFYNRNRSS